MMLVFQLSTLYFSFLLIIGGEITLEPEIDLQKAPQVVDNSLKTLNFNLGLGYTMI